VNAAVVNQHGPGAEDTAGKIDEFIIVGANTETDVGGARKIESTDSLVRKSRSGSDNHHRVEPEKRVTIVRGCTVYYATFATDAEHTAVFSEPLHKIELNFDNARNRLEVHIYTDR
jgi:hypothetical protein